MQINIRFATNVSALVLLAHLLYLVNLAFLTINCTKRLISAYRIAHLTLLKSDLNVKSVHLLVCNAKLVLLFVLLVFKNTF